MRTEKAVSEATLSRLLPHLSEYGITRLANITGLDRVGIPVWMAIRPNSRSLAASQGKGLSHAAAKASALCESIETWYAERFSGPLRVARYDDLRRQSVVADPSLLPLSVDSLFSPFEPIPWVEAEELLDKGQIFVPYELVHADATVPRPPGSGCFVFSTNGLASGNSVAQATLAGLCEVIERDSHAIWRSRGETYAKATRVDCDSISDPPCRWLLNKFRQAEIEVMVWNMTTDIAVPTFRVLIYDRWADSPLAPYPVAYGAACHPCRETALAKALTEAAQSRLTSIAGSRDDMSRAAYRCAQSTEARAEYAELVRLKSAIKFGSVSSISFDNFDQAVERVKRRLFRAGIRSVARARITSAHAPLSVVRIIVPGLEGVSSSPSYIPGRRVRTMGGRTPSQGRL